MSKARARNLRSNMTDAERHLWSKLRRKQIDGHRFRRQVPIGPYLIDFACLASRLLVEVDGGQHEVNADRDAARTRWLEARGYRVLRFWNNDVMGNVEGVLHAIQAALAEAYPPPDDASRRRPPPQGGR
jgi:very-short-patch-repair endonuclease